MIISYAIFINIICNIDMNRKRRYFIPIGQLSFLHLHWIIFFIINSLSSSVSSIYPSVRIVTEILTFSLSDPISLSPLLRRPFFRSSNCTSSLFLCRSYILPSSIRKKGDDYIRETHICLQRKILPYLYGHATTHTTTCS